MGGRVVEARQRRVLDLSSPKLLACWLTEHTDAEVVATDVWEADVERWRTLVGAVDPARERFGRLVLETGDGRACHIPTPASTRPSAYR